VLEKLEREYAGRFKLVKVNVDENQELAEALQVRSIPAVFAFPRRQAARALPRRPAGIAGARLHRAGAASPFIEVMDRAERLIQDGRVDDAEKLLAEVPPEHRLGYAAGGAARRSELRALRRERDELKAKLAANPDDHEARLKLAQLHAGARRYREAMDQLLEIAQRDKNWRDGEARRQLLTLFTLAAGEPELVSEYRRKLASALY